MGDRRPCRQIRQRVRGVSPGRAGRVTSSWEGRLTPIARPLGQFAADGSRAAPGEQMMGKELRQLIEEASAQLPPLYRAAYVLADVEGLANAEVGMMLGLNVPAVIPCTLVMRWSRSWRKPLSSSAETGFMLTARA